MKKKKSSFSNLILVFVLIFGLSLMLYPSFSDYWNAKHQTRVIDSYVEEIIKLDNDRYAQIWNDAREYNRELAEIGTEFELSDKMTQRYHENLNVAGNGVMGYIQIPKINCNLPLYHGVEDTILQVAAGHIEWSSLPTGGESTHSVFSGHRGLPSAKLFSNLDEMQEGDYFTLHILDEVLTYEVDRIQIVLPYEMELLTIEEGKDLCTLVTCTPYGINSHRLLVRGHRVENLEQAQHVRVTADAVLVDKLTVIPFVLVPILVIMLMALLLVPSKKKNTKTMKKYMNHFEKDTEVEE